ncbi:hypothetical protein BOTBODRAFT_33979 [Botryobasidium botryosum FD-172 SS1]|uniref:Uncharacterized protein n=1 Tax=Botryobasidium botryosum (strain FD-172 SS1) TaxID=930990 RepID=A0A067MAT5_BOTB1|nr:hypothetical protein BOTBODRAFT_33979 [Botryobasidium botryosum FD-172 SS1]
MAPTAGTVAEYDMIFAVSQKAINAQFANLYETDNPKNFDEKLIPNSVKLGFIAWDEDDKKWVDSDEGVSAEIECPTVDLNNPGTGGTLYRSLRISIKIKTGTFTYWYTAGGNPKLKSIDVAGYTFSWVAQVGARNIQDLEEEAMHPDAKKGIKDTLAEVNHEDYLVSSLFCLFESTQVANSFALTDANGKAVESTTQVGAWLNSLTKTYELLDAKKYPYVLGYGVSQKIPQPETGTPHFFPAKFWFSTTPYSDDKDQATLNFTMINGDAHDGQLVDPVNNPSAGLLSPALIKLTRATNLQSDGIFAASNNMFVAHWLTPCLFSKIDFAPIYGTIAATVVEQIKPTKGSPKASKNVARYTEWVTDEDGKGRRKWTGMYNVNITYSSTLQSQTSGEIAADTKRNITIVIDGDVYDKEEYQKKSGSSWIDEGYYDATTKWGMSLLVTAADDGKWKVTAKDVTHLPGTTTIGEHTNSNCDNATRKYVDFTVDVKGHLLADYYGILQTIPTISPRIVMPAGDVYTFLGLDNDDSGNVYSHIKYKTIVSGSST